jgi:glycosyltransferase involved in cell wall biosynthesis
VKIVHLGVSVLPILYPRGGAIQRRILELAKVQAARGHDVVIYSADNYYREAKHCGAHIRSISCTRRMPFRDFEYMKKAAADLRDRAEPVDVLHFHSLPEGAVLFASFEAEKLLSFDNIIFRRGKSTPLYWWYRQALRKFDCLLPVSDFCEREFQEYWGSEGLATRVLYNGVNLEQFAPDPEAGKARRETLGIGNEKVVLYVGRICEQKGTDILIRAYAQLKAAGHKARLLVAGPSEQFGRSGENDLVRAIRAVGGLFLGAVEESILPSIYNLADIFVMPTRSLEMFGMAAIEAQACGKPVVCSDHGGLPEVIRRESGLFFPVGDSEALAQRLFQLLSDDALYANMAAAARKNALRFDWDRIADELESICRTCIADLTPVQAG